MRLVRFSKISDFQPRFHNFGGKIGSLAPIFLAHEQLGGAHHMLGGGVRPPPRGFTIYLAKSRSEEEESAAEGGESSLSAEIDRSRYVERCCTNLTPLEHVRSVFF